MAELSAPYATISDEGSASLRARLLTAEGRASDALALLDDELGAIDVATFRRYALKLRIVRATALRAAGRTSDALKVLADCVEEARHEGFVRVFVDEGDAVAALLRELLAARTSSPEDQAFVGMLLAQIDEEHPAAEPESDSAVEALSTRELEVLAHIADGLSNQAIADELIVSLPTVKTHVRSIMSKLGAKNRTEAVATARQSRLLAR
jgi:LuxR family maltose regulon positive regulatory protein